MPSALRLALAAAAAVGATIVLAAPASAWTGGSITGTSTLVQFSGSITCTSSTLDGSITAGGMVTVVSKTFSGCTAPGNIPVTVTASNLPPWTGVLSSGVATLNDLRLAIAHASGMGGSCVYGGNVTGSYVGTGSPVGATYTGTLSKISGSILCPNITGFSAGYTYTGPGL